MTSKELAEKIVGYLAEKHITNLVIIDVGDKTSVTNYYVVGTARNTTVAKTASDYLEDKLEADPQCEGLTVYRKDGQREGKWIVLDYGLVIVHLFHPDLRDFYDFEKLWAEPDDSNVERHIVV